VTLSYVYCLVLSTRRPTIPPQLTAAGIPGGRNTRAVATGDGLWLIVADVPANEYDEAALAKGLENLDWVGRRAMAHEAVVEHFLTARAVLPMQLFTLFTSDDRALQHVDRQRREILAIVKRLERKHEWGLRLTFDEQSVRDQVEAKHAGKRRSGSPQEVSGSTYLARKRDLLDVHRGQLLAARTAADALFATLTKQATDAHRRTATEQAAPGSRLLLDAAFLVPATRTRSFRAAVNRSAKQISAAGVVVALTGPWPPYNFISSPARATARPTRTRGKAQR
jgi:hypothetical protein